MKTRHLILAASALSCAVLCLASNAGATNLTTVTVDALTPLGSWLDSGIDLSAGTTYQFDVNMPYTMWSAGSDVPFSRESTANGIPISRGYGVLTQDGFTANFGALVGEVGPVPGGGAGDTFFLIGTGPTTITGLSGELYVGYWDDNYPDNSGSQSLSIGTVPEPAAWALTLAGFAGLGAMLRVRREKATALA